MTTTLSYDSWVRSLKRPLYAISADGPFPRSISIVSMHFGTPIAAILLMAILNAALIVGPFRNLVVIDVILFIALSWCPVPYCASPAICRGPATPSRQAGNEALAPAAAEAAEDAA